MPIMNTGPVVPRQQMMDMLGRLQHQQHQAFAQQPGAPMVAANINVPQQLQQLLQAQTGGSEQVIDKVEDDVINLVQMLFQFILDDRNLADQMKAMIARLQIPMIKVALLDRGFFSKGGHPARKLLNEIATVAVGWMPAEDDRRDPILEKVTEIVESCLQDFEDDIGFFQTLLEDFTAFREQEKRRTSLVERRTVDAEDGRARSEYARSQVNQMIQQRLLGKPVPEVVVNLLLDAWANVMFLAYLRDGKDSEALQEALATMDKLLWSVQPASAFDSRQQLLQEVPELLKALRSGLSKVGFNPFDMNKLFAELEAEHLKRIKDVGRPAAEAAVIEPVAAAVTVTESTVDAALNEQAEQEADVPEGVLQQVAAMGVGTWVEFQEGDSCLRCRLAAKIKPTGAYIFVNRHGQKVAEHNQASLAKMLNAGELTLLDDGLLFDRALQSVIGTLRQQRDDG
jgi:hypothetical protein